jgi:hypothetical protein
MATRKNYAYAEDDSSRIRDRGSRKTRSIAMPERRTSAFQPRHAGHAKLSVLTASSSCAGGSHATTNRLLQRLQTNAFRTLVCGIMIVDRAPNVPTVLHGSTH